MISVRGNEVVDRPGGKPICDVYVYPNDSGQKPHFHFILRSNKVEGCIRLDTNEYFIHGSHKGTMNNDQLKILDNWLNQKNNKYNEFTNWEYAKYIWNQNENRSKVNIDIKPNYCILNE